MECHQDFSIEFSNYAHYDRHIDTCGVVSRLVVLPTRGGGLWALAHANMGPVGPVLGLLGAAPERFWTAMMGRMMADGKMAVGGAPFV